jgi:hypothetical protein
MIKKLIAVALGLVLLVIVALGIVIWNINALAKEGIQRGSQYALGVDTSVDDVSIGLLRGQLTLDNLTISNPEGFQSPFLMNNKNLDTSVKIGSLMSDTVVVNHFVIDGLEVYIEQRGRTNNIKELVDRIQKMQKKRPDDAEPPSQKKIQVDRIVIRDVTAHINYLPAGGKLTDVKVKVPEIILEDITPESASGVAIDELVGRLVPIILASILENAKGVLSPQFLQDLGSGVAGIAVLTSDQAAGLIAKTTEGIGALLVVPAGLIDPNAGQAVREGARLLGEKVGGGVKVIGEGAGKVSEGLGETGKNVTEGIGKAVGGLLGEKDPNKDQGD